MWTPPGTVILVIDSGTMECASTPAWASHRDRFSFSSLSSELCTVAEPIEGEGEARVGSAERIACRIFLEPTHFGRLPQRTKLWGRIFALSVYLEITSLTAKNLATTPLLPLKKTFLGQHHHLMEFSAFGPSAQPLSRNWWSYKSTW